MEAFIGPAIFILFVAGVGYYVYRKRKYDSAVDDPDVPPKND